MINKISNIIFAEKKLEEQFNNLDEKDETKKGLKRAMKDIKENPFCGTQIPKKLIPKRYIQKYEIKNLWKYNLPNAWRVLYSIITPEKIEILSIIIDWFPHKKYERKFNYII
ncbi:hypothetical protein HOD29_01180 [archaeon]|jgi:Txe/YoeB family toxin of Txe-Axe toxin-antitoxin module|nr:hypothetical protein [archaeon]